jgi:hypothetical protein
LSVMTPSVLRTATERMKSIRAAMVVSIAVSTCMGQSKDIIKETGLYEV